MNRITQASFRRAVAPVVLAVATLAAAASGATAAETVRVAKTNPLAFPFALLDVGIETGTFRKHGIEIEASAIPGAARYLQAIAAGSIDVGLGGGTSIGFFIKGAPAFGAAEMLGPPKGMAVVVKADGPVHTPDDLKGRRIAVTTASSLTDWLVHEFSRRKGWGADGVATQPVGAESAQIAAMKAGQVDGLVIDSATAYRLEAQGDGRIAVKLGDFIPNYILHVIVAGKDFAAKRPQALCGFLAGWFEAVNWASAHKAETVRITKGVMQVTDDIAGRIYDELMPAMSKDGKFDAKGLDAVAQSLVENGTLPSKPDVGPYIDQRYLAGGAACGAH
jgi:sulfonate transport system substrate-binding protein